MRCTLGVEHVNPSQGPFLATFLATGYAHLLKNKNRQKTENGHCGHKHRQLIGNGNGNGNG
jgi:hypothetical protein